MLTLTKKSKFFDEMKFATDALQNTKLKKRMPFIFIDDENVVCTNSRCLNFFKKPKNFPYENGLWEIKKNLKTKIILMKMDYRNFPNYEHVIPKNYKVSYDILYSSLYTDASIIIKKMPETNGLNVDYLKGLCRIKPKQYCLKIIKENHPIKIRFQKNNIHFCMVIMPLFLGDITQEDE
jgi:hypothetical protein